MQLSAEIGRYIRSQETIIKLIDLINLASDKPMLDLNQKKASITTKRADKELLDIEIATTVSKSEKIIEQRELRIDVKS